ncbi:LCP family protein [Paenibacillus sp. 32O-W]|uniref:LCP family protein n=1 Tax=Paenibacillus sp. 32O-W TaxID=1695218 RepID=UPI0011A112FE|nr:LCP family protein [Paenibacillus sp. 32O-W]
MRKKIKWIVVSLCVLLLGIIGYFAYHIYDFANKIYVDPTEQSKFFSPGNPTTNPPPPKWEGKERVNILLLGGDARDPNEAPRSDTMLVASIDPVTKKSYLFSILRDTYVKIPGHNSDRINAALAFGGPNLAMRTASELLGIPIQYYIYTDFQGFVALVDAVGGIDYEVEKDMYYYDSYDNFKIDLKKGYQHLDGEKAIQYVRFRHDATGDYTRTERQRNFLSALAKKMQSTTSLLRLPNILQSIDPYIETNIPMNDMLKLASLGYDAKTEGLTSEQIPPMSLLQEKKIGGASVVTVDTKKLHQYIEDLFNKEAEEAVSPSPSVSPTPASNSPTNKATPNPKR